MGFDMIARGGEREKERWRKEWRDESKKTAR